jgi:hypothetical protein
LLEAVGHKTWLPAGSFAQGKWLKVKHSRIDYVCVAVCYVEMLLALSNYEYLAFIQQRAAPEKGI